MRWLSKAANGVVNEGDVEEMKARLRQIASARDEEQCSQALEDLYACPLFEENIKLNKWFKSVWLPEIKV